MSNIDNTSIDQYLEDLEVAKQDIKESLEKKGATVTGGLSSYAGFIDALETVDPKQHLPNGISFDGSTIDVFDLSPYDWSMVYDYSEMFQNCTKLTGFGDNLGNAFENMLACRDMFYNCDKLTTIPLLDTSKVVNMRGMFRDCSLLTTIPLLDTSKVVNMDQMFYNCGKLTTIPLLDTSKVVNMNQMFYVCIGLTSVPQLDTSSVTNMNYMVGGCSKLTSIPQLDTSKVVNMRDMFYNCNSLTTIPLLDCSSVTNTYSPIGSYNLSNLTDIGGFKNLKVSWSSNFLDRVPNATVESLMNVINNLYDLTSNGLSGQTLKFGTTNLNKLTADQKAVATNKGWTLT